MTTLTHTTPTFSITPLLSFARAQLIGQLRNWRSNAPALFTPMLLLLIFTLTGDPDTPSMVPFIVGFTVMFSGQTLAQILIGWRNNRVFTRFAATPTPTSHLIIATIMTQVIIFVLQGILVMILGVMLNDLQLDIMSTLAVIAILIFSSLTFISFGAMIAAFVSKVETASMIYTFTLLPIIFLGGAVIEIPGFSDMGQYLPPTLLTNTLNPFFGFDTVEPVQIIINMALMLGYSVIFTMIATRFFRTSN